MVKSPFKLANRPRVACLSLWLLTFAHPFSFLLLVIAGNGVLTYNLIILFDALIFIFDYSTPYKCKQLKITLLRVIALILFGALYLTV